MINGLHLLPCLFIQSQQGTRPERTRSVDGNVPVPHKPNFDTCCCLCLFPWSSQPITTFSDEDAFAELSKCMKEALESRGVDNSISQRFLSALLLDQPDQEDEGEHECAFDYELEVVSDVIENDNGRLILKGVPDRPYYKELSRRVILLHCHYMVEYNGKSTDKVLLPRPLIDAERLGLTENKTTQTHTTKRDIRLQLYNLASIHGRRRAFWIIRIAQHNWFSTSLPPARSQSINRSSVHAM